MSDRFTPSFRNGSEDGAARDPFASNVIDATISADAGRRTEDIRVSVEARLLRGLKEVYVMPEDADAAIERVRVRLTQAGMTPAESPTPTRVGTLTVPDVRRPGPAFSPRRLSTRQAYVSGAMAAVIAAALIGAFILLPLLRPSQSGPIVKSTPTPTSLSPTATTAATATATHIPAGRISQFAIPTVGGGPWSITRGYDGALWFVEYGAHKIGRITTGGHITEYTVQTNNSYSVLSITSGPDNAIWFTEVPTTIGPNAGTTGKIGRITSSGQITEFPISFMNSAPAGIAAGSDGNLWFTDSVGQRIVRMTPGGQFTAYKQPSWVPPSGTPPAGSGCVCLAGIASGPDGALWFVENGANKIGRITVDGRITEYAIPTPGSDSKFITAGPDGAMWFTETINGVAVRRIGRISLSGHITEFLLPATESDVPAAIATGPDGALWFTLAPDPGGPSNVNKIGRITTDGQITEYPIPAPEGDWVAGDITSGPDGALWFTEYRANKIGRITV
ncbi:MAG TPA: hypothetical protein VF808_12905 [Ktedonobacterales bacterium]